MQEASFNGFLRTIIYMIGFYYLIKFLLKIFLPIIMKSMINKAQQNFNNQQQSQNPFANQQEKVHNPEPQSRNPKAKKQVGEYIDYEELE
jgi:hypothetical protein